MRFFKIEPLARRRVFWAEPGLQRKILNTDQQLQRRAARDYHVLIIVFVCRFCIFNISILTIIDDT